MYTTPPNSPASMTDTMFEWRMRPGIRTSLRIPPLRCGSKPTKSAKTLSATALSMVPIDLRASHTCAMPPVPIGCTSTY